MATSYRSEKIKLICVYSFLMFTFFSLIACWDTNSSVDLEEPISPSKVTLEEAQIERIQNLNTHKLRDDYLVSLWHKHQIMRGNKEAEIMQEHGYLSEAHKQYLKEFANKNEVLFLKLKSYLNIHGYPTDIDNYRRFSRKAFPLIIGQHPNYNEQLELTQQLYQSYKNEHCYLEDLVLIMSEMHKVKFGNAYTMSTSTFKTVQEFDELNRALELNFTRNQN